MGFVYNRRNWAALCSMMLLVSGLSMLLAWLKLRKRNLGPILDANGWAVNARARINIPFGASLTATARLPENAERSLADPSAEKKSPWKLYLLLLIALAALVNTTVKGVMVMSLGSQELRRVVLRAVAIVLAAGIVGTVVMVLIAV